MNDIANIIVVAYQLLSAVDKVYLAKIKEFYIYYQMNSGAQGRNKDEVANEFDSMRENVERN